MSIGKDEALPPAEIIRVWQCPVRVVNITDADTIKVDIAMTPRTIVHGEGLRIYGVDTPESSLRATKNPAEVAVGKLVKEVVKRWVYAHSGEPYATVDGKDFCYAGEFVSGDKYSGRIVTRFYGRSKRGKVSCLSDYLIENDLAFRYFGETKQTWGPDELSITEENANRILEEEK